MKKTLYKVQGACLHYNNWLYERSSDITGNS